MPVETYKINMIEEGVEKDLSREDISNLLKNDVATVTFTKKDGSERVMKCTLIDDVLQDRIELPPMPDIVPENIVNPSTLPENTNRYHNPDTLVVWDLELETWRSFILRNVKSIGFPDTIHTDSGKVLPPRGENYVPVHLEQNSSI